MDLERASNRAVVSQLIAERRISDRAFIGQYALAIVLALIAGAALLATPFAAFCPVGLLFVAAVWGYSRLARMGGCYRLYSDRLEVDSGIVNRKIENVELFRVRDVGLRQGFVGRIFGFGDVYLHSTDSSTPDLHIHAIDDPKSFYEQVRELVSASRAGNRTLIVEEGHGISEA